MSKSEASSYTQSAETLRWDIEEIAQRTRERLKLLAGTKLLVVGGGGFLPGWVLDVVAYANDEILDRPCTLICVDNFSTSAAERLRHLEGKAWFRLLSQDIRRPLEIERELKIDYLVHGASIPSPSTYRKRALETLEVNAQGTRHLLEFARWRGVRSFVYLSSSEVYGDPPAENIPTPETYTGNVSFTGPRACYDESKRLAETLCSIYHRDYGMPVKIVRPFNVYGPRLRLDDGRVITDFIRDALNGGAITVLSDGRVTRSFCYISDAVTAILMLLLSDLNGEAFNVGNSEEISIAALADAINELFERKPGVRYATSSDPDYLRDCPHRRCPDLTKLRNSIHWSPKMSLREGLQRTIQWYRQDRVQP
jgi:UDP-glucuronate decarboxylase